ncbi:MAG TPA: biotin carboxylase N-terminal domain-containing protein [Tepidiformaceae bacterium]|nr:biotin carboxylase N-terminal domain-containing protein [Tepidiformaceae bacterium]
MPIRRLLIANRGEIAIRIMRSAAARGIETVAVYSEDDAASLHVRRADEAHALSGTGARAYLDIERVIGLAAQTGCDAIHPGYGFLSENAAFARRCAEAGIRFVGPSPEVLDLFGDKAAARAFAERVGAPVLSGAPGPTSLEDAAAFLASLGEGGAVMLKAVAGGGGRGMRLVERPEDLESLYKRCQSEATSAFGRGDVYVEELIRHARHIGKSRQPRITPPGKGLDALRDKGTV